MTSAPAVDVREHRAVLTQLIEARLGAGLVFAYGEVPGLDDNEGETPPIHVLLTVERRYADPRYAGRAGVSGWRATTRCVGTVTDEADWAMFQVTTALDEIRLSIDGHTSTPVTHESTTAPEPDDGMVSGLLVWTYAL